MGEAVMEERRMEKGIGPRDAVAIFGLNPKRGPVAVFLEKMGEMQKIWESATPWREKMKEVLAEELAQKTGYSWDKKEKVERHPEYPFIVGVQKYTVVNEDGKEGLLDIRLVSEYRKRDYENGETPMDQLVRVHHNMVALGLEYAVTVALIGGGKLEYRVHEKDPVLAEEIIRYEHEFWSFVEKKELPKLDGSKASEEYLKQKYPVGVDEEITLPKQAFELLDQYKKAKEEEKLAKEMKDQAANQLKNLMGDHERAWVGTRQIRWATVNTKRFNAKRFQQEHPELYEQFVETNAYRRFDLR